MTRTYAGCFIPILIILGCSTPRKYQKAPYFKSYVSNPSIFSDSRYYVDTATGYTEEYLCNDQFLINYIRPEAGFLQKRITAIKEKYDYSDFKILHQSSIESSFSTILIAHFFYPSVERATVQYFGQSNIPKALEHHFYAPRSQEILTVEYFGYGAREGAFLKPGLNYYIPFSEEKKVFIRSCNPKKDYILSPGTNFAIIDGKIQISSGKLSEIDDTMQNPFCFEIAKTDKCIPGRP